MNKKLKPPGEWFKQADYDLGAADDMLKSGRYIYTIFMCHLSIEKALKGLYTKKFWKEPPKIHDLKYLANQIDLQPSEIFKAFINELTDLSVPTRYPEEIEKILKYYKKDEAKRILSQTGELLRWLKEIL